MEELTIREMASITGYTYNYLYQMLSRPEFRKHEIRAEHRTYTVTPEFIEDLKNFLEMIHKYDEFKINKLKSFINNKMNKKVKDIIAYCNSIYAYCDKINKKYCCKDIKCKMCSIDGKKRVAEKILKIIEE